MAIDPRNPDQVKQTSPKINLEEIARAKISEVIKKKILSRTNYQEPDDTCECDDFVTNPPNPPIIPTRKRPPGPPKPPKIPIISPPLPPPPARYTAPQLPNAIPPLLAPPPLIFPDPNINIDIIVPPGGGGGGGESGGTGSTSVPPTNDPQGDDVWEGRIPCCLSGPLEFVTDYQLALGIEESTHSGEFRNGCYPMCNAGSLAIYRLGWTNPDGSNPYNTSPPAGFCDRSGIQICQCFAKNNPSNPCYKGNGQISPPGGNITSTSALKRLVLPNLYTSPDQYYASNITST